MTDRCVCGAAAGDALHRPCLTCASATGSLRFRHHPFKKESAMPQPLKVHIGTIQKITLMPGMPGVTHAEVAARLEGVAEDFELLRAVGGPIVLARYVDDMFEEVRKRGAEERAVIDAANGWYDRMVGVYGRGALGSARGSWVEPLWYAVKALRDAKEAF